MSALLKLFFWVASFCWIFGISPNDIIKIFSSVFGKIKKVVKKGFAFIFKFFI